VNLSSSIATEKVFEVSDVERVMKKFLLVLIAMLTFACSAFAQKNERQAQLDSLVQAERDFASTASAKGIKDAFLAFAADDGIIFGRIAVNAKQTWSQREAPTGLLSWQPVFADVSRAGDLGYTTGPYEFREKATDEKPAGQGNYMTIWRKQPDGTWKFALDFGTTNPPTSAPFTAPRFAPDNAGSDGGGNKRAAAEIESARAALIKLEQEFSAEAAKKGTVNAYLSHLADDARLLRQNAFPLNGKEQIRAALNTHTGALSWRPAKADVSLSGDLAYAYGAYESKEKTTGSKPSEQGNYVRIWKRQPDHQWKIVVDVMNPVRPPS
jgi:ketosteroid isomerase-like protein